MNSLRYSGSVKPNTGIKGMDVVLRNLNREIDALELRSKAGLIEAAILIRVGMDSTPPLIPIDTGNLRASWFTASFELNGQIGIVLGFNANYAIFVHEMMDNSGKKINWSRPGSGPKFFEAALKRNKENVLNILKRNMQIR